MNWAHKEVGLVENVSRKWVSTTVKKILIKEDTFGPDGV